MQSQPNQTPNKKVHAFKVNMSSVQCADAVCKALEHLNDKDLEVKVNYKTGIVTVISKTDADDIFNFIQKSGKTTEYMYTLLVPNEAVHETKSISDNKKMVELKSSTNQKPVLGDKPGAKGNSTNNPPSSISKDEEEKYWFAAMN